MERTGRDITDLATARERGEEQRGDMMQRLQLLDSAAVDAVTDTRKLVMQPILPEGNEPGAMLITADNGGNVRMLPTQGAHECLVAKVFSKVRLTRRAYDDMLTRYPVELSLLGNSIMSAEPEKRLLRMHEAREGLNLEALAPYGATYALRAMLSNSYRPINHLELVQMLLAQADQAGAWVHSWQLTETRFNIKFVTEARELQLLKQDPRFRDLPAKQRSFEFGATVWNSETGHSSFSMEDYFLYLYCINGWVVTEKWRVTHLGRRLSEDDDSYFQLDTKRVDNAALFMKARDRFARSLVPDTQLEQTLANSIGDAAGDVFEEAPSFAFIENVGKGFDMQEGEQEMLAEEYLAGHNSSRWGVSNAVTAVARRINDDNAARGHELEKLGWDVLRDEAHKTIDILSRN